MLTYFFNYKFLLQQATGIDLKLPDRKRRKKTDETGLTDIKKEENTVYKRLEKKIFNKYVHF